MKKKRRIILKKKSNSNSTSEPVQSKSGKAEYEQFAQQLREAHPNHHPGIIREWYEKCFNDFPPWNEHGIQMCKYRVSYHLYVADLKMQGKPVPDTVAKNYKAFMEFNINGLNNGVIKHSILAELKQTQGGNEMPRQKEKKVTGAKAKSAVSEKAYETWIRLMAEQPKKKLNDTALAKEMQKAHPGKKVYDENDVARHRSLYNNGKIKSQSKAPKVRIEQYGASKNGAVKTKAKPAKKTKAVKKVEPVAKKKVVLKKKKS